MDTTAWLSWIIVGVMAGWFPSLFMNRPMGLLLDIILGIVGAVIGGFLFSAVGVAGVTGFNTWSLLAAFIGAVVLLGSISLLSGRGTVATA